MIRLAVALPALCALCYAADSLVWEPARVTDVQKTVVPAREPDASCNATPRGTTPPPQCRPQNLRAQTYWRMTIETGSRRMVVRPYKQPTLGILNENGVTYLDPMLAAGATVEVAIVAKNTLRYRTDLGQGNTAQID